MKNTKNKQTLKVRRSQLRRFTIAVSNAKLACEFAFECMELLKKARDPELIEELVAKINEVMTVLSRHPKGRNFNDQCVNKLSTLGATYLGQLSPEYTLLARVTTFKIPGLLM